MSAHPSCFRPCDQARGAADDNEHSALLFACGERRASQPARLHSERLEAHTLPWSPRLASPSHARRHGPERCYCRRQHTADLADLLLLFVCMPPSACLLGLLQARALITNAQRLHCQLPLDSLVIRPRLKQSSLILPVFTNWPTSCSSNPDSCAFVCQTLRNSSLPAQHYTAS